MGQEMLSQVYAQGVLGTLWRTQYQPGDSGVCQGYLAVKKVKGQGGTFSAEITAL
jgi:hypothetical protein